MITDISQLSNMPSPWLLHTRCLALVQGLFIPQLYLLMHLVEPAFVIEARGPASEHGAFYLTQRFSVSRPPAIWQQKIVFVWDSLWGVLHGQANPSCRFPRDIWLMVLRYGIDYLLFIMRTASQLDRLEAGLCEYPKHQFTVTETALKSD